MAFRHMVSMKRTPAERAERLAQMNAPTVTPDEYPFGLSICFDENDLEKLDLDDEDVEVGDYLHLFAMAKVTNVSKSQGPDGTPHCRIEMVLARIAVEDEDLEEAPDDDDD